MKTFHLKDFKSGELPIALNIQRWQKDNLSNEHLHDCVEVIYVLSGVLDEKSAVQMAVDTLANAVDFPLEIENNKYTCEYSPEISALRVTNESLTGESAWVVAIVVTQTVTEAANVEA